MTTASNFAIGTTVTTSPTLRPRRFAGRTGTVAIRNDRDDEVGVWLGGWRDGNRAVAWFRPGELDSVSSPPVCPAEPLSAPASTQVAGVAE